jgi:hypothetical protein
MNVMAFFFNADDTPKVGGSYGDLPKSMMFKRILEKDQAATGKFRMWSGDLTLRDLANRATEAEVKITCGRVKSTSITSKTDTELYRLILWDFLDSLTYQWTSIDIHDLTSTAQIFGKHNIYVLVVSPICHEWAVECDQMFGSYGWYIGAAEMDISNPSHQQVINLPHRVSYIRRHLGIVGEDFDKDSHVALLNSQGEWPFKLPFLSVETIGHDNPKWTFAKLKIPPATDRAKLTLQRLKSRARQTHFDKVARALQNININKNYVSSAKIIWNGKDPIIDRRKLVDYFLTEDPSRREGFAKARVFRSALSITAADWRFLKAQLEVGVSAGSPNKIVTSPYGVQYDVLLHIQGRNGNVVPVVTGWLIEGESPPRLTTAYVAKIGTPVNKGMAVNAQVLPIGYENDWQKLHELAQQAGNDAVQETVPTPMFLSGGSVIKDGECGSAWVTIPDGRHAFPKWLVKNKHAFRAQPGVRVYANFNSSQSVQINRAYAEAYAHVLKSHGIKCVTDSRLD